MEVLFKIGVSGGYRDGDVIFVKPDGWRIPAATMAAWLATGKEPAILAEMPRYLADRKRRQIAKIRWKVSHTAAEIEAEFKLSAGNGEQSKAEAENDSHLLSTIDSDTNWGTDTLKHHGVLRVADMTMHEVAEVTDSDETVDHLGRPLGKARYKVPYKTLVSAEKVAEFLDRELMVYPDRELIYPKTICVEAPHDVAVEVV